MPSRLACGLIMLLWLISTAWLIQRDVLPSLGLGELTYDRVLSARAVEEPVEWQILREATEVGSLFFAVDPKPDGTFELQSKARVRVALPALQENEFNIDSIIYVDPLKRLDRMRIILSLPQSNTEVHVDGKAEGDTLAVSLSLLLAGKEQFRRDTTFAVERSVMVLDIMGQIDRLPDLRPGKTWRTRFINPLTMLLTSTVSTSNSLDYIEHRVVGVENVAWNEHDEACYKVEHRYQKAVTYSWARVRDGKVLVQEVLFGGVPFRLVAIPGIHDKTTSSPNGEGSL